MLFGNTALKLLRRCPCPVWVAKPGFQNQPVQVLLAQGRAAAERAALQRALALLLQQRQEAERTGMPWRRIKALALQALAYQALGDMTQSLTALEQALVLAAPEGYVRIFLDEGAPMLALLPQVRLVYDVPGWFVSDCAASCAMFAV